MPTTLNKAAYQKLIDDNIRWLLEQPRTLERDHIRDVLLWDRENRYSIDELTRQLAQSQTRAKKKSKRMHECVQVQIDRAERYAGDLSIARLRAVELEAEQWYLPPECDTEDSPYGGKGQTWIQYAHALFKEHQELEAANAGLVEVRDAASNHVRCMRDTRLSPYIRENGRHGGSPWFELVQAVAALPAQTPARPTDEGDN